MRTGQKQRIPPCRLHAFVLAQIGLGPASGESRLAMAAAALVRLGIEGLAQIAGMCVEANRDAVSGVEVAPAAGRPMPSAVISEAFLQTYERRRLRMQTLTKCGARSQCGGAMPALRVLCAQGSKGKGTWDMTDWCGARARVP